MLSRALHHSWILFVLLVSPVSLVFGDSKDGALRQRLLAELPSQWSALENAFGCSKGGGSSTEYHVTSSGMLKTRAVEFSFRLQKQSRLYDVRPVLRKAYDRKTAKLVDPLDPASRAERSVFCVCPDRSFNLRWQKGASEPYIALATPTEDRTLAHVIENGYKFGIDIAHGDLFGFPILSVLEKPYATWQVEETAAADGESVLKIVGKFNPKQYWDDQAKTSNAQQSEAHSKVAAASGLNGVAEQGVSTAPAGSTAQFWLVVSPARSWAVCQFGFGFEGDSKAPVIDVSYVDERVGYPRLKEVVFSHPQRESVNVVRFRDFDLEPCEKNDKAFTLEAYGLPDDVYRTSPRSWRSNPLTWLFSCLSIVSAAVAVILRRIHARLVKAAADRVS
jgi:hypothetical protein